MFSVLNDALHIVTGCLRPTPTYHLLILSGIQPVELCRLGATLSLAYRGSLDLDHIMYDLLSRFSDARQERQRSKRPFVPAVRSLLNNLARLGIRASGWTNHKWNAEYYENTYRLRVFIRVAESESEVLGRSRSRTVKRTRSRVGVGIFYPTPTPHVQFLYLLVMLTAQLTRPRAPVECFAVIFLRELCRVSRDTARDS